MFCDSISTCQSALNTTPTEWDYLCQIELQLNSIGVRWALGFRAKRGAERENQNMYLKLM